MANYATLKAAIQNVIKANGNNEITGSLLQQSLVAMINSLGAYYQFAGVATPTTNPGTPDQNVFYIAADAGVYSNFNSLEITASEIAFFLYNGSWTKAGLNIPNNTKIDEIELSLALMGVQEIVPSYSVTSGSYVNKNGVVASGSNLNMAQIAMQKGDVLTLYADCGSNAVCPISRVSGTLYVVETVYESGYQKYTYYASEDCTAVISYYRLKSVIISRATANGLMDAINKASEYSQNAICVYNVPIASGGGDGYINASGNVGTLSGTFHTDYLPVFPGQSIKLINPFVRDAGRCALYGPGKEFIRAIDSSAMDAENNLLVTIGENERFLRCGWYKRNAPARVIINECASQFFRKEYGPYKEQIDSNTQSIVDITGGDEPIDVVLGRNGYYVATNGRVNSLSSQGITAPIFLRKGETIKAKVRALTTVAAISITDENGSAYNPVVIGTGDVLADYSYQADADLYVAVSGYKVGMQLSATRVGQLEQLDQKIDSVSVINTTKETPTLTKITGYYINNSGSINQLSGYFYTDLIPLLRSQTIVVTSKDASGSAVARISAWSSDGNTFKGTIERGTTETTTVRYTATQDVEYLRLSGQNSQPMTVVIETDDVSEKLQNVINDQIITAISKSYPSIAMFERVGCCGDSYVKGQLYGPGGLIGDRPNIAWGSVLGRLNGLTARIYASSGADTNTWQSRSDCLPLALSEPACGLYIFCMGINDYSYVTLGSITDITGHSSYVDYPNTFYGNYGKIIEQILAHAPGCKIILMPPFLRSTTNYYNYAIGALREITQHYGIALIDTAESELAQSNFFNQGLVGAHPTSVLHSAMGKNITELVNKCIERNYDYFKTYYGV